jgi:ABC-2 type transport system ATP-binding protein
MQTHDPVIQVDGLVKRFGDLTAVAGISFEVGRGEVFGILGPNGAGKTTALECIEGLQTPSEGRATVLGIDVRERPDQVKGRIGVQLQASAYFEQLTLAEILRLFGRMYSQRLQPMELLERVDLVEKAKTTVGKLSGGQKQRFALAASLVNDPEVLFLDEPTTGLDPQARRNVWELIERMHAEGRTVVLTTHYMEEAQVLCQRVAIMDGGLIAALDTPTNLVLGLPVPYHVTLRTTAALPLEEMERLEAVRGVEARGDGVYVVSSANAARTLPDLLGWIAGRGVALDHLEVVTATLEDVFLELTGKDLRE